MSGFTIRIVILLVGFVLVCVPTILERQRYSPVLFIAFLGPGLILIIVSLWMASWRIYQCAFTIPDQIKIVGHIRDDSNSRPNNYLVLFYLENDEIARNLTRMGKFEVDSHDQQNDGYFELTVPNEYQLNLCSMPIGFRQNSFGHAILGFGRKTTYVWRNFADVEVGKYIPINIDERKKKYTLVVLPSRMDNLPKEISDYPTYLDPGGNVAINVPLKTYTVAGNSEIETTTNDFVRVYQRGSKPVGFEVRDAWVEDGNTKESIVSGMADNRIIDINNCAGPLPIKTQRTMSISYAHEVNFRTDANPNYDLGIVALKASASLGFTQGQIEIEKTVIDIDVPAGAHKKYKVIWQELWKEGVISIDLGQERVQLPFRAKNGLYPDVWSFAVDCP
jgi:hypothetical protein